MIDNAQFEGLILAAGNSSRFKFKDGRFKKYFLKLCNSNILGYIASGMIETGISKIKIVTSKIIDNIKYRKIVLKSITRSLIDLGNLELDIIENKFPERENGYSLLLGLNKISTKYTILSMADHIFSENIFIKIIKNYKKKRDILLATDPMKRKGYYDINDATKVLGKKTTIQKIRKNLTKYNRLDMGVFILKTKVIKKICKKLEVDLDKFSVTDIVLSALDSDLDVGYNDFSDIIWLDIDNFKNYHQLQKLFNKSSSIYPFGLNPTGYNGYLDRKNIYDQKTKYEKKNLKNKIIEL